MGTADHNAWGNLAMVEHSIQGGSSNIPSRFMQQKPELSTGLMGLPARTCRLYFILVNWCKLLSEVFASFNKDSLQKRSTV